MRKAAFLTFVVLLTCAATASASPYNFNDKWVEVEYWAGSGSNMAMCVVDFGDDSYAFGYRWAIDENKTGKNMLDAVDATGSLDVTYDSVYTSMVLAISYDGHSHTDNWPGNNWWGYYTSDDGNNWIPYSGGGAAARMLTDDTWDGWAAQTQPMDINWLPTQPPTAPVPEPTTLVLLGIGGAMLLRRRLAGT